MVSRLDVDNNVSNECLNMWPALIDTSVHERLICETSYFVVIDCFLCLSKRCFNLNSLLKTLWTIFGWTILTFISNTFHHDPELLSSAFGVITYVTGLIQFCSYLRNDSCDVQITQINFMIRKSTSHRFHLNLIKLPKSYYSKNENKVCFRLIIYRFLHLYGWMNKEIKTMMTKCGLQTKCNQNVQLKMVRR